MESVGTQGREGAHSKSKAMWEEDILRTGVVGSLQERMRVGELRLRSSMSELVRDSVMRVHLASASVHVVYDYQAGLWTLKSPMMMLL